MAGGKRGLPLRRRGLPRAEVVGAGGEVAQAAAVRLRGLTAGMLEMCLLLEPGVGALLKGIFGSLAH